MDRRRILCPVDILVDSVQLVAVHYGSAQLDVGDPFLAEKPVEIEISAE